MGLSKHSKKIEKLKELAKEIRQQVLRVSCLSKSAHVAASLSTVDILVGLYFSALKIRPSNPCWPARDRFILRKGHGCLALYATLNKVGFISASQLESFCRDGSCLGGHPEFGRISGIESSTGSLGHGLSIGLGMALAFKADQKKNRVFVLLSDGECNEGSVWEAAMSASHFKVDNICAIIDYNKLQATGRTKEIMSLEPLGKKWDAFGWASKEIDGHNIREIVSALKGLPFKRKKA